MHGVFMYVCMYGEKPFINGSVIVSLFISRVNLNRVNVNRDSEREIDENRSEQYPKKKRNENEIKIRASIKPNQAEFSLVGLECALSPFARVKQSFFFLVVAFSSASQTHVRLLRCAHVCLPNDLKYTVRERI